MAENYDPTTEELIVRLRWAPEIQRNVGLDPVVLQRVAADQLYSWINGATGEQIRQLQADLEEAQHGRSPAEPEYSAETWAQRATRFERLSDERLHRVSRLETELKVAKLDLAAARHGDSPIPEDFHDGTDQTPYESWRQALIREKELANSERERADEATKEWTALVGRSNELRLQLERAKATAAVENAILTPLEGTFLFGYGEGATSHVEDQFDHLKGVYMDVHGVDPNSQPVSGRCAGLTAARNLGLDLELGGEDSGPVVEIPLVAVRLIVVH